MRGSDLDDVSESAVGAVGHGDRGTHPRLEERDPLGAAVVGHRHRDRQPVGPSTADDDALAGGDRGRGDRREVLDVEGAARDAVLDVHVLAAVFDFHEFDAVAVPAAHRVRAADRGLPALDLVVREGAEGGVNAVRDREGEPPDPDVGDEHVVGAAQPQTAEVGVDRGQVRSLPVVVVAHRAIRELDVLLVLPDGGDDAGEVDRAGDLRHACILFLLIDGFDACVHHSFTWVERVTAPCLQGSLYPRRNSSESEAVLDLISSS